MNDDAIFPIGNAEYDAVYAREAAMVDASELIAHALETSGMSKADLAGKLGVRRSEITARLQGERDITVRELAETLHALGGRLALGRNEQPA
jgi:transcriptional regulator with XRE-family HTH domain